MEKQRKIIVEVPLVLLIEKFEGDEYYIVSCDALSLYSQGKSKLNAEKGFDKLLGSLFTSLIEENSLIDFLNERSLIKNDIEYLKSFDIPHKTNLNLGHRSNIPVEIMATC